MMKRVIGKRKPLFCIVSQRPVEWLCAITMTVIAATLSMPGQTFSLPSYAAFVADGITEGQAILFFGGIGAVRMIALCSGGLSSVARVRQVGAMCGGIAFIFASATFTQSYFMGQPMPVNAGLFAVLAAFEGYSIQMAGLDRRNG